MLSHTEWLQARRFVQEERQWTQRATGPPVHPSLYTSLTGILPSEDLAISSFLVLTVPKQVPPGSPSELCKPPSLTSPGAYVTPSWPTYDC